MSVLFVIDLCSTAVGRNADPTFDRGDCQHTHLRRGPGLSLSLSLPPSLSLPLSLSLTLFVAPQLPEASITTLTQDLFALAEKLYVFFEVCLFYLPTSKRFVTILTNE
jgi:hypothetical protein